MPERRRVRHLGSDVRVVLRMRRLVGTREWARTLADHYRRPSSFAWYRTLSARVAGRRALEIGGPSSIFRSEGPVPLYPLLASWDDVDYRSHTLWSPASPAEDGKVSNGCTAGRRFLDDATRLSEIGPGSYEAILTSHVIEHLANPLRALAEWRRVLVRDGVIVAVVPEGARTFDHTRRPTPMTHLWEDFRRETSEDDLEHLPEILATHDLSMDPGAVDREAFAARSYRNADYRALHHHVFSEQNLRELLEGGGFTVEGTVRVSPSHLLAWGHRTEDPPGQST